MKNDATLSVPETARELNCTLKYVFDLLYAGKLQGAIKVRGKWAIPLAAVDRWRRRKESHTKNSGE